MTFDIFIDDLNETQQEIVLHLDQLFMDYPEVTRKIRFKVPFYFYKSWLCYLNPLKKNGQIELCFLAGHKMSDMHGLLDSKGRKMVSGISINTIKDIDPELIMDYFYQAIVLDEESKKKS